MFILLLLLSLHPKLPVAKLTPGLARDLSKAQVCETRWGRDARHVTLKMKREVCAEYGISKGCPGPEFEIDHLIPRELLGADDLKNVWPQEIKEARLKDRLENYLHREVCAGRMTLPEAQRSIREDWWAAYLKAFPIR